MASYPSTPYSPPTVTGSTSRAAGTTGPAEVVTAHGAELVAIETDLEAGLPVARGGTGATTAANARTNLGVAALDATSTDIQALGTQAAGSKGLAADAGHVHPTTGVVLTANNGSDFANKLTVLVNLGVPVNPVCDLVATGNITQSGSQTVDGVSTSTLRVLCVGQSTASQNGIWLANTSGAWTRPADFATASSVYGRLVQVVQGTLWTGAVFALQASTSSPVTVDTSSQTWYVVAAPVINITSTTTLTLPPGSFVITAVGGGGSGGGGGSALTSGGVSTQAGGGGGGQGQFAQVPVALTTSTSVTATIGAGGASVSGGAVNGNAGTNGNPGGTTTVTGTGVSVSASGGGYGKGGAANSTATTNAGVYGCRGAASSTSNVAYPGCGSTATSTVGYGGGAAVGVSGWNGGGGCPASATYGGSAGAQDGNNYSTLTGTSTGGSATGAPSNSGLGGPGGGGGAPGGAGGAGGAGGSGLVAIEVV